MNPLVLVRRHLAAFHALWLGLCSASVGSAQTTPVYVNVSVHDPSVRQVGGTWYILGSFLTAASTTDLMKWTPLTTPWDATTNPTNSLIAGGSPGTQFSDALTYVHLSTDTSPATFWGPDWIQVGNGKYAMYYCVCSGTSRAALGIAYADAITGPYTNYGILLESGMWGQTSPDGTIYNNAVHPNCVDPTAFYDKTGAMWLVYGSFSGGIFILSLDPATGLPYAGQAYGKKLTGGNNCTIEGSYIFYSQETGYYYLMCTFGQLDSTGGYNIRMGRSLAPNGPYVDAAGNDLTNVQGAAGSVYDNASIAPYFVKLMGNCQFLHIATDPLTASHGYVSPGGVSVTRDSASGKTLMVFHSRFVGTGEYYEVRVHQLFMNADGWPVVAPTRYAQETMATASAAQLSGVYKLINHGKDITATVKTSTLIALNADHSITGDSSGSWQLLGDHYATVTLGGVAYDGVFVKVWDDDNQVWSQSFTATSSGGVSVWGLMAQNAAPAPIITSQPGALTVSSGASAAFSVSATGLGTLSYQWLKNGTAISGATSSSYSISSAGSSDAATYTVTVANSMASVTSNGAQLTVSAAGGSQTGSGSGGSGSGGGGGGGGGGSPSAVFLTALAVLCICRRGGRCHPRLGKVLFQRT